MNTTQKKLPKTTAKKQLKMERRVGPTTAANRPVRSTSRNNYYLHYLHLTSNHHNHNNHNSSSSQGTTTNNTSGFTGPVRKWVKKWVHVAPSEPSNDSQNKKKKSSNGPGDAKSSSSASDNNLILCKWTPLPPSSSSVGRKLRYTPITVYEEQMKKLSAKTDLNNSGRIQSGRGSSMDSDEIYGMLDINNDPVDMYEETKLTRYSRKRQMNPRLYSEKQSRDNNQIWCM